MTQQNVDDSEIDGEKLKRLKGSCVARGNESIELLVDKRADCRAANNMLCQAFI